MIHLPTDVHRTKARVEITDRFKSNAKCFQKQAQILRVPIWWIWKDP